jgi:phage terminase large subunit-like protein
MARKPLDPVTQYATDVMAGTVIAAHLVRLACARHLRDLETGAERGLAWDPAEAQLAIDFFPDVLCLPENTEGDDDGEDPSTGDSKPFVLSPFQQFIVGSLFGWFANRTTKSGKTRLVQRFRVAYVETAKGSGKTPLGAGILIQRTVRGDRGAQNFCAAVGKDQAKIAFADCDAMVKASPHLAAVFDQKVNNLAILEKGSFIRPISSEKRGLDGKRVYTVLIDEEHEHPSNVVYLKMRAGTKGRKNALVLVITNSGFDRESVCWHHHDYSRQVLEGTIENDSWFAFVCHLDPCEKCRAAGQVQPSDECPDCDDWKVEGPHWLKANPNLGVSLPWQYLREQVREAVDIPSQRNMVRRLNFCQWTQQATIWITPEAWSACQGTISSASLVGRECYLGIDLSEKIDLASVEAIFPRPLERDAPRADGMPPIACAIDMLSFFWMPERTIHKRAMEDKIPYPDWQKSGHLFATPGALIDHDAIVDFIINELAKKYQIKGIGIDQAGATAVVTRLQRHFGDELAIEIPQGFRMLSDPSKTFEALVVSQNLQHDGNPVMTMCVTNMGKEENSWQEIRPVKLSQRKRIDGGVAAIDGIKVMQVKYEPAAPFAEAEWIA